MMSTRVRVGGLFVAGVAALVAMSGAPFAPSATAAPAAPVPDSAMLQPADLGGVEVTAAPADLRPYLRPPRPGPAGWYRSQSLRQADRAVSAVVPVGERPTVVLEYVATYRAGGASRYLRELHMAVSCPGRRAGMMPWHGVMGSGPAGYGPGQAGARSDGPNRRWSVVDAGLAGPGSLLLRLDERIVDPGGQPLTRSTYVAVARTGATVVVVADLGWETGSGHEAVVRDLIGPAVRRAG
jgi:hypothetical protein